MYGFMGFVDGFRIHQLRLIDYKFIRLKNSEKAARVSFVARRADLFDHDQNRVRIAIDADFGHALAVPTLLALSPKRAPRSAVVCRISGSNGFQVRLLIHPSQHKDFAASSVLSDGREQAVRASSKIWLGSGLVHR